VKLRNEQKLKKNVLDAYYENKVAGRQKLLRYFLSLKRLPPKN